MLDLQAGVDFEEDELVVGQQQELDGARILVTRRADDREGGLAEAVAQVVVDAWRRRLFDDLLAAALHGAVALAEMDGVAEAVGEDLHLDVAAVDDRPLGEQAAVAEGRLGLAARGRDGLHEVVGRFGQQSHPAPAAAGRCLEHHGVAELPDRRGQRFVALVLLDPVRDGDSGCDRELPGLRLVAELRHHVGRRADPDQAGVGAGAREVGVLRQKAVAGVHRIGA